jgi:hypothetical protein
MPRLSGLRLLLIPKMEHNTTAKIINSSNPAPASIISLYLTILFLPFLMFHWMVPFVSDMVLGNDYPRFSIQHQMELMFSMKTGSFPLYVPGFAGGQSASALTLGQIFHPISHIAALLPGYWNGKALEWNTFLRLVSLAAAQLVLFAFLIRLSLSSLMSFTISTITVYNFQTLFNFHTGASLESWTGLLFLCAAIGLYRLKPTKWRGPLFIIGSTYWLVCSGQPQMMYYGLLGAGLFTLLVPYFLAVMLPDRHGDIRDALRFWVRVGLYCGAGILLSSAYVFPFYFDFLTTNAERVGQGYTWANAYQDSFIGTLNNFFQPLRSIGRFGGSSLFLAAVLVPALRLFRVRVPGVIWVAWGLTLLVFLHMQGSRTPVHYFMWKYLPFASSTRDAGRISFVMPILFMLALAWAVRAEAIYLGFGARKFAIAPRTILAITALFLLALYALISPLVLTGSGVFWPTNIRHVPPWVELFVMLSGMAALAALAVHGSCPRARSAAGLFLCLITCAQISAVLRYGLWIQEKKDTPSFNQMLAEKRKHLEYSADLPGLGLASTVVIRQAERSFLEPFLGKVYTRYLIAQDNAEAYALMEQGRTPDQVVVEQYTPEPEVSIQDKAIDDTPDHVSLEYSSFNRLIFQVWASRHAFFGLAYPYTGHWKAFVNGRNVRVYRANGAAHAVRVPAGHSTLEFCYWSPAAFCGMILSCATLSLIGIIVAFSATKKPIGVLIGIAILVLSAGAFTLWYHSLYSGDNLGTRYAWTASPPAPLPNLAYGKRTQMSSYLYANRYPYIHSSSRAVDGDRTPGSSFITDLQIEPWWMIDLNRPEAISSIVVYECPWSGSTVNTPPLFVALSNDKEGWVGKSISKGESPLRLTFPKPTIARYVLIKASGSCHLSLDEVEIYPPAKKNTE